MGSQVPDTMYNAVIPRTAVWVARYPRTEALPQDDDPAWSVLVHGEPTVTTDGGMLQVSSERADDTVRWWYDSSKFASDVGVVVEAYVRVSGGSTEQDSGFIIEVRDGQAQFVLFLRPNSLNLHECSSVDIDFASDFRLVTLVCAGTTATVLVDGSLIQSGPPSSLTDNQRVGFGTAYGFGYATAEIAWIKARQFYAWEEAQDGGYLMTIGPYDLIVPDLPAFDPNDPGASMDPNDAKCCWVVVEVDHSDIVTFSLAEPPVVTPQTGSYSYDLEDNAVYVVPLAETNGGSFKLLIMNMGYGTDLGYHTSAPDIALSWTRTGLVTV